MPTHDQEPHPTSLPKTSSPNRRAFLLRCWRERDEQRQGRMVWRFSVREVGDDPKEQALRSLGQLVDFLLRQLFASNLDEE